MIRTTIDEDTRRPFGKTQRSAHSTLGNPSGRNKKPRRGAGLFFVAVVSSPASFSLPTDGLTGGLTGTGFCCFEGCSEFALKLRPSRIEVGCGISSKEVYQPRCVTVPNGGGSRAFAAIGFGDPCSRTA
jgi:hypothetical protein